MADIFYIGWWYCQQLSRVKIIADVFGLSSYLNISDDSDCDYLFYQENFVQHGCSRVLSNKGVTKQNKREDRQNKIPPKSPCLPQAWLKFIFMGAYLCWKKSKMKGISPLHWLGFENFSILTPFGGHFLFIVIYQQGCAVTLTFGSVFLSSVSTNSSFCTTKHNSEQ